MLFGDGSQDVFYAILLSEFAGQAFVGQQSEAGDGYLYVVVFFEFVQDAAEDNKKTLLILN